MAERPDQRSSAASGRLVDIDRVEHLDADDLEGLERGGSLTVGVVEGRCDGARLAAAVCVHLLVAGPSATFGMAGDEIDLVLRRGTGLTGRRVAAYVALSGRFVDAERARCWGLVTEVCHEPRSRAEAILDDVGARSGHAVRTIVEQAVRGSGRDHLESRHTGRVMRRGQR